MALTKWKELDDIVVDNRALLPYWRRQWYDDYALDWYYQPRDYVEPTISKNGFEVVVDVQYFRPHEIAVKTEDNVIVVEAKREIRHGWNLQRCVSREFIRRYVLPSGYDANTITSELSSDGFLTIKAPLPKPLNKGREHIIPIKSTYAKRVNSRGKSIL